MGVVSFRAYVNAQVSYIPYVIHSLRAMDAFHWLLEKINQVRTTNLRPDYVKTVLSAVANGDIPLSASQWQKIRGTAFSSLWLEFSGMTALSK